MGSSDFVVFNAFTECVFWWNVKTPGSKKQLFQDWIRHQMQISYEKTALNAACKTHLWFLNCNILYHWSLTQWSLTNSSYTSDIWHTPCSRVIKVITWGKKGPHVSHTAAWNEWMCLLCPLALRMGLWCFSWLISAAGCVVILSVCMIDSVIGSWQPSRDLHCFSPFATLLAQHFTKLVNNLLLRDTVLSGCFKSRICPEVKGHCIESVNLFIWICSEVHQHKTLLACFHRVISHF